MDVRLDLPGKLTIVDGWVREEFVAIGCDLEGAGCDSSVESGPGCAYQLDGRVVLRVHPKQRYLGLGFPDALRDDVEALTSGLRAQRGGAWFNYGPDMYERSVIETLVDRSLARAAGWDARTAGPDPRTRAGAVLADSLEASTDEHDLRLIFSILQAFATYERAIGRRAAVKTLREAIYFHWEAPRLPPGGKRSPYLPHTERARAQRDRGEEKGLVYEHVVPISVVIGDLLAELPDDTAGLRDVLDATAERVIITTAEDAALRAAGQNVTAPILGDVWSRYRAAGIDPVGITPWK